MRSLSAVILLAACSSATTATPAPERPGSRGLHADEHLDAAREHDRRAKELARWPESRATAQFDAPGTSLWYRAWDSGAEHERLATTHRSAAAHQQAGYEEACRDRTREASISPLQRYGLGGTPTADGVMIFLSPLAGPPERLLADLQCHRAWMMLSSSGMDECPLDLDGVHVEAHGDTSGITVEIKVRDRKLVPELQRRASRDLEAAAQHAAAPH